MSTRRPVSHQTAAANCRQHPGQWLPIGEYINHATATSIARAITKGHSSITAYLPVGAFEARTELTEDATLVSARYVGPADGCGMSARARIHAMFPILLDNSPAETEARTAELDARLDALVAEARVLPPVDAAEFMQLCTDLDTARARIAVLEKATPTTDLHQTFLAAVQSFRSSVHQPGGWAQQFTTHLMTAINPPGDDHTPDFFQPGHTYQQGPWAFRCGTVTAHPQTGEPHALGWLTVSDGSWTTYAYSADAWGDDWTDITTQGDNK